MSKGRLPSLLLLPLLVACQAPPPPAPSQALLIVTNRSDNRAVILDGESGEPVGSVATGVSPREIAASSASGLAVATNYGSLENPGFSLTVIDLGRKRVHKTISLGRFRRPYGVRFLRDGRRVLVAAEGSRTVVLVNLDTARIEKAIPTTHEGTFLLAVSPDEKRVYATDRRGGRLAILDVEESRLIHQIRVGRGAEGVDVSPDGREIWVACRLENRIMVVDAESFEVADRLPCSESPIRLRFTPDGNYVLVSNTLTADVAVFSVQDRKEVLRIPMTWTAEERSRTFAGADLSPVPNAIVFDQGGRQAFVSNGISDTVSVIDLVQWRVVQRWKAGNQPDGLAFVVLRGDQSAH